MGAELQRAERQVPEKAVRLHPEGRLQLATPPPHVHRALRHVGGRNGPRSAAAVQPAQLLDDSAKSGVQLAGSAAPMIVVLRLARSTAPGREDGDAQPNDEAVAETAGQDSAGLPVPLAYSVTLPCDGAVDLTSLSTDGFADPLYQPVALLEHSRPQRRMWNPRRECYEHQLGLMHNHCGRGQIFGIGCIPRESGFCILLAKAKANVMVRKM